MKLKYTVIPWVVLFATGIFNIVNGTYLKTIGNDRAFSVLIVGLVSEATAVIGLIIYLVKEFGNKGEK